MRTPTPGDTSDAVCMTYADQTISGGQTQTVTTKACRAPDGTWKTVETGSAKPAGST